MTIYLNKMNIAYIDMTKYGKMKLEFTLSVRQSVIHICLLSMIRKKLIIEFGMVLF